MLTGQMFDVPVKGTHAHSWIMSFPDEYTAFKAYAKQYPNACILLVDTYDVLDSGVPNAIRVFKEMQEEGIELKGYGIRIDSGDLAGGTYTLRELLVPVFLKGECVYTSPSVMEIRDICAKEKETLWSETMRLVNPQEVYVDLSDKLYAIKSRLLEEMGEAAIE